MYPVLPLGLPTVGAIQSAFSKGWSDEVAESFFFPTFLILLVCYVHVERIS